MPLGTSSMVNSPCALVVTEKERQLKPSWSTTSTPATGTLSVADDETTRPVTSPSVGGSAAQASVCVAELKLAFTIDGDPAVTLAKSTKQVGPDCVAPGLATVPVL